MQDHRLARPFTLAVLIAVAVSPLSGGPARSADGSPPAVTAPVLTPATQLGGAAVGVAATAVDDEGVAAAEVQVDGGPWRPMTATTGAFGDPSVDVAAEVGASGVASMSIGDYNGCALLGDSLVHCWGSNAFGQVGDGTLTNRNGAVPVSGLQGVTQVVSGHWHACAVLADTTVRCWGSNWFGQLGDGTTVDRASPVAVAGLSGVTSLTLGIGYTCAVLADTTVRCWGSNSAGELGDGTTTIRHAPTPVLGVTGVVGIAAGWAHTCAVLDDGTASCWGLNQNGQLGRGDVGFIEPIPAPVTGLSGAVAITAARLQTCAALADGTASCWGANDLGQLGDGTTDDRAFPGPVTGLSTVRQIDGGESHTCALLEDTSMWCWGSNASGALGAGIPTADSSEPVIVGGLTGVMGIGAGSEFSCALRDEGQLLCWGFNGQGRLGSGTDMDQLGFGTLAGLAGALPGGTHEVCVRAIDTSGSRSDGSACATLTVAFGHTSTGERVQTTFADASGGPTGVTGTFTNVTSPGESSATVSTTGPTPPATFQLGDPATFYELSTTATFESAIVCINVDGVLYTDEAQLHILHFEDGAWVDVTWTIDHVNKIVCGRVTSFSPFIVAEFGYQFDGFLSPIDNLPVRNAAKAGAAIPIKFTLAPGLGLDVLAGAPVVVRIPCGTEAVLDEVEETVRAGGSSLAYDAATGRYTYVWKTDGGWANTCRRFTLRLGDGSEHSAEFSFRK